MQKKSKVAFVIHPLYTWGGAEAMLRDMIRVYPNSDVYTAWYDKKITDQLGIKGKVYASYLQKFPLKKKLRQELIPLLPKAYKKMVIQNYDLVWVISDQFEKQITLRNNNVEVLNIMTPPRFLWMDTRSTVNLPKPTYKAYKSIEDKLHPKWQSIDKAAVKRFKYISSISNDVRSRVAKIYGEYSEVLYPPVKLDHIRFTKSMSSREKWFLYLGRIESYKGIEMLIEACAFLKHQLKIAGTGSDIERMRQLVAELEATDLIEIMGFVSEEQKLELLEKARALVFPVKDEDFGIVPIEAMAAGCPVIAFNGGGAAETVVHGSTGILFDDYTAQGLVDAIHEFEIHGFKPNVIRSHAQEFSYERFENKFRTYVDAIAKETLSKRGGQ
ncbi:MAG: glycosyltransferase [Candidatus Dojkabacteria bacterium]|nr:MAG: glycosyltransferase [Candidatus Dojkabacteria bacterium]